MLLLTVTFVLGLLIYFVVGQPKPINKSKKINRYKELKDVTGLSKDYIENLMKQAKTERQLKYVIAYLYKNDKTLNLHFRDRMILINQAHAKLKSMAKETLLKQLITDYQTKLG